MIAFRYCCCIFILAFCLYLHVNLFSFFVFAENREILFDEDDEIMRRCFVPAAAAAGRGSRDGGIGHGQDPRAE
ncbi:hypothetical protein SDC9_149598 [bioreactor metagenome]|uniref:Uncharacterized protein n=1 Tax=bioreactor metagenome TaxID=1076179 RepID=A0A645EM75_9ZZZZ